MHTVSRLYQSFQPSHYQLTLDLSARIERRFSGSVVISGTSLVDGSISLHATDLTFTDAYMGSEPLHIEQHDDEITLSGAVIKGKACDIRLTYEGTITDGMHGVYPCYYEVDGVKKELLATQFESHHAREVFPCVDEPEAKATFDLTLITETDIQVLSNMPVKRQVASEQGLQTTFNTTPRMSTYLLAFVVGELQKQTAHTKSGVEVNVWATYAQPAASLSFPLEVATRTIDFFDEYFGLPYPLPKADHVALPDFSSGAMENWGLITYREIALLVDDTSSVSTKEYVATVIAHETSHQWFGNLVTMKWWDDLWLNESFATLMEYVAIDALYPEWQTWNTFASQETLSALRRDQLAGVQAVRCEVNHPDEISTLFDPSIVYAKGARLLKMLRAHIGEDAFREGLRAYFQTFAYQNTIGADLWRAFSAASGKDIEQFMDTWISQSGFPVVTVTTTETGYSLDQQRMVIGAQVDGSIWPIPLFAHEPAFPPQLTTAHCDIATPTTLPLLNRGNEAHFVSHYDDQAWQLILAALDAGTLDIVDRLALLHETSLLARADITPTATLIPLLKRYQHEESEPVWNIISMVIADLKRFVEDNETSERQLKALVTTLALPLYKKLGNDEIKNEPEQHTKLRATIVGLLSYAEYQPVIDHGIETFRNRDELEALPSELRGIILAIAAKHGTDQDFKRLLDAHRTTHSAEFRDDLTAGLCATKDSEQVTLLLERITDPSVVKQQDVFRWYIYLLRNRYARAQAWQWMTNHWEWIEKTFKGDKSYDDFARYSASVFSSRLWLEKYVTFFEPMQAETALRRAIEVGRTEIETRAMWLERDIDNVVTILAQETA